ncbi:FAD-dependent monooxygenase [Mesorhizobium sp. 1B3]|uniref:FAD-dependent monooxygenase n=1 Tax=Mesorhizobium sp. 1B3 TaxID=3243599 RepID=UPI003D98C684
MKELKSPILVVGGGIGGLAVAFVLAGMGHQVRVFEQAPNFEEVGAGVQLGPNGVRALDEIGLRAELERCAWTPAALMMRNGYSAIDDISLPLTDCFVERFGNPYLVVHRADLLQLLLDACAGSPLIELNTGAQVVAVGQRDDGVVLSFADGTTAGGAALIGADGLRSVVRKKIVGDGDPPPPRLVVYRSVISRDKIPDELWSANVVMWSGTRADFVHYPLRRGELFNLVATFEPDYDLDPTAIGGSREDLLKPYLDFSPGVKQLLELVDVSRRWMVTDREPVERWSDGRIVLLGDSAHPMLQYMAQGACQALEDVVQLGREVASSPADLESAFSRYAKARYLRTARVQAAARYFVDVCQAGPVLSQVRKTYFDRAPVAQIYDDLAWLYAPGDERF